MRCLLQVYSLTLLHYNFLLLYMVVKLMAVIQASTFKINEEDCYWVSTKWNKTFNLQANLSIHNGYVPEMSENKTNNICICNLLTNYVHTHYIVLQQLAVLLLISLMFLLGGMGAWEYKKDIKFCLILWGQQWDTNWGGPWCSLWGTCRDAAWSSQRC